MIPLKLTLQGIYSYREKQTIDFDRLTSAGLFGIFGQVGSGKSTILFQYYRKLWETEKEMKKSESDSFSHCQGYIPLWVKLRDFLRYHQEYKRDILDYFFEKCIY